MHSYTIARLFGLEATDFRTARVLELGCASGGNLIPLAAIYPDAEFLGIDLSARQIEQGIKDIDAIGLSNIRLQHYSIMDIDETLGKFDYIITHGVYSWVPDEVQDKILNICHQNLMANGIAYISYNTLPGWNAVKSVREMMLYHTNQFSDPKMKMMEAKKMLQFAIEVNSGNESAYLKILEAEAEILSKTSDEYMFHDHLELENRPCYFHDFISSASRHNLQYLGDAEITSMYLGNYSAKIQQTLKKLTDIVRLEQYLDFLVNRRFRSSLMCHGGIPLMRNISSEKLMEFHFSSKYVPMDGYQSVDLDADADTVFSLPGRASTFTSHSRIMTAIICVLGENSMRCWTLNDLVSVAAERLAGTSQDEIKRVFMASMGQVVLSGILNIAPEPARYALEISEKPEVYPVARQFILTKDSVPNILHEPVFLPKDVRVIMKYLDGQHTIDEIATSLLPYFESGELTFSENNVVITDREKLKNIIPKYLDERLQLLLKNALLIA